MTASNKRINRFPIQKQLFALPVPHRFMNLNTIPVIDKYIVINLFYYLRISLQTGLMMHILFGSIAVLCILFEWYLPAAITLHIREMLAATNQLYTRLKKSHDRTSPMYYEIGNTLTAIVMLTAFAVSLLHYFPPMKVWLLTAAALVSILLHNSTFIFYYKKYSHVIQNKDGAESFDAVHNKSSALSPLTQKLYTLLLQWQYHIITTIDALCFTAALKQWNIIKKRSALLFKNAWYGNKIFLTVSSLLGYHISIFMFIAAYIAMAKTHNPTTYLWPLWFIIIWRNGYWILSLCARTLYFILRRHH